MFINTANTLLGKLQNTHFSLKFLIIFLAIALIKFYPVEVVKSYVGIVTLIAFLYLFKLGIGFYRVFKETNISPTK